MIVEVRLFATLTQFLPPGSKAGTVALEVPDGARISDVTRRLGIPASLDHVALLNGSNADGEERVHAGDVIDIFPPLAGGR